MTFNFLENEYWYGGVVHIGYNLPISADDDIKIELVGGKIALDQYSPLFLSSKGRIIHSDNAFDVHFKNGEIIIDDAFSVELIEAGSDLRSAHMTAAKKYFGLCGKVPNLKFFETPQYNTWIELTYNQNQKQILEYARTLINGGMSPGVLMIDEGWSPDYGTYEFDASKFTDPKAMIDELHEMGFSVMLWVTPMISPDSNCFRELRKTNIIIRDASGEPAIRKWWNGYSCVLDFTNPECCEWFDGKLNYLMDKYGVDGFKFDSGDTYLYRSDDKTYISQEPNKHTTAFNRYAERYAFNELRNVWDCGGLALICRLQDKAPAWDNTGLGMLIPNMLTQGILGYYFGCPDMVGGGAYGYFAKGFSVDEELYLRWLSASILCPMMQFSISPKRILTDKSFEAVQKLVGIRAEFTEKIIGLAKNAAENGEPIMRYMEYQFPNNGYEKITDQFMLGDGILVAPILTKGEKSRDVVLPDGKWASPNGEIFNGGRTVNISAALDELIILKKEKQNDF